MTGARGTQIRREGQGPGTAPWEGRPLAFLLGAWAEAAPWWRRWHEARQPVEPAWAWGRFRAARALPHGAGPHAPWVPGSRGPGTPLVSGRGALARAPRGGEAVSALSKGPGQLPGEASQGLHTWDLGLKHSGSEPVSSRSP